MTGKLPQTSIFIYLKLVNQSKHLPGDWPRNPKAGGKGQKLKSPEHPQRKGLHGQVILKAFKANFKGPKKGV